LGQVFAAPVLPFIREVKRFPDEPGARHLTCQLFAQAGNDNAPQGGALLGLAGGSGALPQCAFLAEKQLSAPCIEISAPKY
jgi:hypothetical protein